ncbi:MAG: cobalt transporter CbiM [Synergistetes bacterium]|nr:cobalt transporter CbiM [Synergistota bacterium]
MHISEGVLSAPVLATGALLTASGTYLGLKRLKEKDIPTVGVLSSAFFVASLIHVPLGPTSVHLILNGLNGIILRWAAFPSLLVALFLQAVLLQFGGLTTLGVNTFNMAFPAVLVGLSFGRFVSSGRKALVIIGGALAGALAVGLSGICVAISLAFTGQGFLAVAKLVLIAHIPIMMIEAIITPVILLFIAKVNPSILRGDER